MANIDKITINGTSYDIEDTTARDSASTANSAVIIQQNALSNFSTFNEYSTTTTASGSTAAKVLINTSNTIGLFICNCYVNAGRTSSIQGYIDGTLRYLFTHFYFPGNPFEINTTVSGSIVSGDIIKVGYCANTQGSYTRVIMWYNDITNVTNIGHWSNASSESTVHYIPISMMYIRT